MSAIRVRFAPSPTGFLHVGGARTALFNWLFARHHGGAFILRIEDTDRARNSPEASRAILDGLRWLGLDWDEGPEVGGPCGPYLQSEREDIYLRHFETLRASGRVYEDAGAWRFRASRETIIVRDLICGDTAFDTSDPATHPDITIRRPDGGWIFHFVNVVDDLAMGITHVIRGEDHLPNTPKHIDLYRALGAEPPAFAHIPLILNPDGTKMSKRDQGAHLGAYIEAGYLPEAVANYLCLLGWSPKDDTEKMTLPEIVTRFDLSGVNRKPAGFDPAKLLWLQGEYARELPAPRLSALARDAFAKAGTDLSAFPPDYVEAAIATCAGKFKLPSELPAYAGFYFREDFPYDREAADKQFTAENRPRLEAVREAFASASAFGAADIEAALKATAAALGVKAGVLVHPTRLACTGSPSGPSLYHLIEVLGKLKTLARIERALTEAFPPA